MRIFKDIITGDELFTDSNKLNLVDDCLYEVLCTHVTRREGDIVLAGANPSAEEEDFGGSDEKVESGLDLVLNQKLQTTSFKKADYKAYLKTYTKSLIEKWKGLELKPEELEEHKTKFTEAVKKVLPILDSGVEYYIGESCNPDGMVAILEYRNKPDGSEEAYMLFYKHGLLSEKV